jgi:hypothetical protein
MPFLLFWLISYPVPVCVVGRAVVISAFVKMCCWDWDLSALMGEHRHH